jgi:hypothetical protein
MKEKTHGKKKMIKKMLAVPLTVSLLLSMMVGVTIADDPTTSAPGSPPDSALGLEENIPTLSASVTDYGWIYGTVTAGQTGIPVNLASITIYKPAVSVTDAYNSRYVTYSANTGVYKIFVPPGVYVIDVFKKGYSTERETSVTVVKEQGTQVDFVLKKASVSLAGRGILTGTVYGLTQVSPSNENTEPSTTIKIPLKGARVAIYSLTAAAKVAIATAFTDGNGSYELSLVPGKYIAIASKGLSSQQKEVTIGDKKITELDFILKIDTTAVEMDAAISTGNVGGEIVIQKNADQTYSNDVIIYDSISIIPITISSTTLVLRVAGNETSTGKTIAITLDPTVFTTQKAITVKYDGTIINAAESIEDILNPNNDGSHPEFITITEDNGTTIYVTVPHFSEHEILIESVENLVGAFGGLTAVVLFLAVFGILGVVYILPCFLVRKSR